MCCNGTNRRHGTDDLISRRRFDNPSCKQLCAETTVTRSRHICCRHVRSSKTKRSNEQRCKHRKKKPAPSWNPRENECDPVLETQTRVSDERVTKTLYARSLRAYRRTNFFKNRSFQTLRGAAFFFRTFRRGEGSDAPAFTSYWKPKHLSPPPSGRFLRGLKPFPNVETLRFVEYDCHRCKKIKNVKFHVTRYCLV